LQLAHQILDLVHAFHNSPDDRLGGLGVRLGGQVRLFLRVFDGLDKGILGDLCLLGYRLLRCAGLA